MISQGYLGQPIIWPNFPEKCMKMKKFWAGVRILRASSRSAHDSSAVSQKHRNQFSAMVSDWLLWQQFEFNSRSSQFFLRNIHLIRQKLRKISIAYSFLLLKATAFCFDNVLVMVFIVLCKFLKWYLQTKNCTREFFSRRHPAEGCIHVPKLAESEIAKRR